MCCLLCVCASIVRQTVGASCVFFFFLSSLFHRHDVCVFGNISFYMPPSKIYLRSHYLFLSISLSLVNDVLQWILLLPSRIYWSDFRISFSMNSLAESLAANATEEQRTINEFVGTVVFCEWKKNEKVRLLHFSHSLHFEEIFGFKIRSMHDIPA